MDWFVQKLDQQAPCFAISGKAYYKRKQIRKNVYA